MNEYIYIYMHIYKHAYQENDIKQIIHVVFWICKIKHQIYFKITIEKGLKNYRNIFI